MPTFNSIKDLNDHIKSQVKEGLYTKVSILVKDIVREFIQTNLYEANNPNVYQRTEQFLNSVTIEPIDVLGSHIAVEIFIDGSKLEMIENPVNGMWNSHADINMGDIRNALPYWLEQGTPDDGKNFYPREGAWFMKDSKEYIENKRIINKSLISFLKSKGISVK